MKMKVLHSNSAGPAGPRASQRNHASDVLSGNVHIHGGTYVALSLGVFVLLCLAASSVQHKKRAHRKTVAKKSKDAGAVPFLESDCSSNSTGRKSTTDPSCMPAQKTTSELCTALQAVALGHAHTALAERGR